MIAMFYDWVVGNVQREEAILWVMDTELSTRDHDDRVRDSMSQNTSLNMTNKHDWWIDIREMDALLWLITIVNPCRLYIHENNWRMDGMKVNHILLTLENNIFPFNFI